MLKIMMAILFLIMLTSTAFAANNNFNCPEPNEITSTNFDGFAVPSIWVAPGVPHAAHGTVGLGLGGKTATQFLGAEAARISGKRGWICVYRTDGGMSVNQYQVAIIKEASSISYLNKYIKKINKEFETNPYLKKYPKDIPLGFIGYSQENEK